MYSKFYIVDLYIHFMAIRKELDDVLALTAELTHGHVNEGVRQEKGLQELSSNQTLR